MPGRAFSLLSEQIDALREFSSNPQQRVRSGFDSIDIMTEGPAEGEVYTFLGRSHSGKSQVATNIMLNNADTPLIFFSLEMPARQVVQRMYSAWSNVTQSEVLRQTKAGSLPGFLDRMGGELEKQVVVDRGDLSLGDMSFYLEQFDEYYGERPHCVIIDYLELIQGGAGDGWQRTESNAKALKGWAKDEKVAVWLLHQANRSEKVWTMPTEDSARGAGYTESDVMISMWQPWRDPGLTQIERRNLMDEIHLVVIKNRITGRTNFGSPVKIKLEPTLKLVDLSANDVRKSYA